MTFDLKAKYQTTQHDKHINFTAKRKETFQWCLALGGIYNITAGFLPNNSS